MQHAGGQRHALLPSAGELAGKLVGARRQAQSSSDLVARLPCASGISYMRATKSRFSRDGQVLPEGESLCHVADIALDLGAVAQDVEAQAGAAAGVGLQQSAHHADGGGLAAAVGAQEAEDLAAAHAQRQRL